MLLKDLIKDENNKMVKEKYAQIYNKQIDKKYDKLIDLLYCTSPLERKIFVLLISITSKILFLEY